MDDVWPFWVYFCVSDSCAFTWKTAYLHFLQDPSTWAVTSCLRWDTFGIDEFPAHLFCLLVLVWIPSGAATIRSLFFDIPSLSLLAKVHRYFCGKAQLNTQTFPINKADSKKLHMQEHEAWAAWLLLVLCVGLGRCLSLQCYHVAPLGHYLKAGFWAKVSWQPGHLLINVPSDSTEQDLLQSFVGVLITTAPVYTPVLFKLSSVP